MEGGAALGVSHLLVDPLTLVRVYRGVLTNICPARRDTHRPLGHEEVFTATSDALCAAT